MAKAIGVTSCPTATGHRAASGTVDEALDLAEQIAIRTSEGYESAESNAATTSVASAAVGKRLTTNERHDHAADVANDRRDDRLSLAVKQSQLEVLARLAT
jgi:hypothetical protein